MRKAVRSVALLVLPVLLTAGASIAAVPADVQDLVRAGRDAMDGGTATATCPGGAPDVLAGNVIHYFINIGSTPQPGYEIHDSTVVPSTPPVFVPGPVPFHHEGGPLRNVRSTHQSGFHSLGSSSGGTSVGTACGQTPPVHGPGTGGLVADTSIDFVGFATVTQTSFCFFGSCVSYGVLLGDGVMTFDGDPLLPDIP